MSKNKNNAVVAAKVAAPAKNEVVIIDVQLPKGRPMNPDSARQKHLAAIAAKGTTGKRGRPMDPTSARQAKLAGFAEKIGAGIELKRGRPTDVTSKRQEVLSKRNERLEQLREEAIAKAKAANPGKKVEVAV